MGMIHQHTFYYQIVQNLLLETYWKRLFNFCLNHCIHQPSLAQEHAVTCPSLCTFNYNTLLIFGLRGRIRTYGIITTPTSKAGPLPDYGITLRLIFGGHGRIRTFTVLLTLRGIYSPRIFPTTNVPNIYNNIYIQLTDVHSRLTNQVYPLVALGRVYRVFLAS